MTANFSFISSLYCPECKTSFSIKEIQTYCNQCNAPLVSIYDLKSVLQHIDKSTVVNRPRGMWRWHELLPVRDPHSVVTLGEGDTPLVRLDRLGSQLVLQSLFLKDESTNPTHCFKARGLAAAVSKAIELGICDLVIPTAGNAGAALAAYASRAGMAAHIFMPKDTPSVNIRQCHLSGAEVFLVDGLIDVAGKLARKAAEDNGWFDVSTFREPFRLEGKKVMGFEIAESFHWDLPDTILYPTGGGTGLVGIWKAFKELGELGWLESKKLPRMVAVQSSGCAPVVKAFQSHSDRCEKWENAETIAYGLRVPKSFADKLILQTLAESQGYAIAVTDEEILNAQSKLAKREGLFVCPEGAATFAALEQLISCKLINKEEKILLLNTGSGLLNLDIFN